MAIAADTGGAVGPPFVKFTELGDTFVGAFASSPTECRRQARDFDTRLPAVKPDGNPRLEEVMWFVAMPGTTARTGDTDRGFSAIEPGAEVRYAFSGHRWGQVIDARKALPAAAGFAAGQVASGDVYTITLTGWSAETKNAAAAERNGFTVVKDRIILRSQDAKDAYVLAQSRSGGNTNPAKDFTMTIARPTAADKRWEQAADAMFLAKPWKGTTVAAPADDEEDPF